MKIKSKPTNFWVHQTVTALQSTVRSWYFVIVVLFLQRFDIAGLVIWPVKIVLEMTYNVLTGTFSLYATTTSTLWW